VAAVPLIGLIAVSQLDSVKYSASSTALATFGAGLTGCASTILAIFICAAGLAQSMQGEGPKCVTGAAVFLPVGAIFTMVALLVGVCLTISRAIQKQKLAGQPNL